MSAPTPMRTRLSIIVPVYNEAQTIGQVLDRVSGLALGDVDTEVIVVDDGSTDGSAAIIEARVRRGLANGVAHLFSVNRGKGAAVRFGFAHATGDIVMVQDADLELDPAECVRLIAPILSGEAAVVYGSRFIRPGDGIPARTRWANRFLTWCANVLFDARLTDMETAYKVLRRDVLQALPLRCSRFDIEPEITARVLQAGFPIVEVPVGYRPRRRDEGKKVSWIDGLAAIGTLLRCRLDAGQRRPGAATASADARS
jgi:glycosyltransferase involved in cell wall biosynthesis